MERFLVIQETSAFVFCSTCKGTGKTGRIFQGKKITAACTACGGTGKTEIKHRTEIPLEQALSQLTKTNHEKR